MVDSVGELYRDFKSTARKWVPMKIWLKMTEVKNFLCGGLETVCEWCNFRVQWFKAGRFAHYQPLPWIGKRSFINDEYTLGRWEAIRKEIKIKNGSVLDIGCNVGFFSLSLAQMGFYSIGIDMQHEFRVISEYAQKKAGIGNAAFSTTVLAPDNISSLPTVDIVIFLSVWHHWIKRFGHDRAREMLRSIWEKTNHVLFIDIKEEVLINELEDICAGGSIKRLGNFDKGVRKKGKERTLFAVSKDHQAE